MASVFLILWDFLYIQHLPWRKYSWMQKRSQTRKDGEFQWKLQTFFLSKTHTRSSCFAGFLIAPEKCLDKVQTHPQSFLAKESWCTPANKPVLTYIILMADNCIPLWTLGNLCFSPGLCNEPCECWCIYRLFFSTEWVLTDTVRTD